MMQENSLFITRNYWGNLDPSLHKKNSVSLIMSDYIIALLPVLVYLTILAGFRIILFLAVSVFFSVLTEFIWQKAFRKTINIRDLSAALTGIMLVLLLPSEMPLWMVAVAAVFSIIFGKQVFGGLGYNIFNPAIAGWLFITIVFPNHTGELFPIIIQKLLNIPGINLDILLKNILKAERFTTNQYGSFLETSVIAFVPGIIYLFTRGRIKFSAAIPYALVAAAGVLFASLETGRAAVSDVFGPVSFFSVFILAADAAVAPLSINGGIIYGTGCGIFSLILLSLTGEIYVFFIAVFIMNSLVRFIDNLTVPIPHGISVKKSCIKEY